MDSSDDAGDPACWAALVCAECGAMIGDGPHRPDCPLAGEERTPDDEG